MAYKLFLLFIISFFLHIPERIPVLGMIRLDLLLIVATFVAIRMQERGPSDEKMSNTDKILIALCVYIVVSLPLVQWPGSVINTGIPNFIKAVIFYYYSISLITTERKLKTFMVVFIACQSFRVFEPVYLHLTQGYWGSFTSMNTYGTLLLDRLSGAPSDVVNPNGLAFVITSVIPFFHYTAMASSFKIKLLYFASLPVFLYALVLTASRTGILALAVIVIGIIIKSQRRMLLIALVVLGAGITYWNLTPLQRARYLSITESDVPGAESAHGRMEGLIGNFKVAMKKPIIGYGLGTSLEANANVMGNPQPAHDLYAEVWQELGIIGLVLFLMFIASILKNFRVALQAMKSSNQVGAYLFHIQEAMMVWMFMNILFSFASFGLSSYEWYLFGGLSIVMKRLATASVGQG
jgi:O-antigen ligase